MSLVKTIAYTALDTITGRRGVKRTVDGRTIKFPAKWSRYYAKVYDPETFLFLETHVKKGDTVLDIGAHIGLFSVALSNLVGHGGRVFSFEPTPLTRNVLSEVIVINGCEGIVEVRGEAVSCSSGTAIFYDTGVDVSNANSLVKTDVGTSELTVKMISVDDFVKERGLKIACLKIDVEGAELDLLRGALETFVTQRPVARLGLHPPFIAENRQSLDDIWRVLSDYKLIVVFDGQPVEKEWFCSQTDLFDVNLLPF